MTRNTGSGVSHDAAWLRLYAAVAALPLVLTACGGGGGGSSPSPSPSASIAVTPSNTGVTAPGGGAVTLTAAVTGSTATPTWTLSGPGTLSASSGTVITYTPPTTTNFDSVPVIVSASVSGASTSTTLAVTTAAPGLTWANVTAPATGTLQSVDYFNTRYVAVSDAGNALVSADAATWTQESALSSNTASDHFDAYAVGHLGSTLVAVGSRSPSPYTTTTGAVSYSTDGLSWTPATLTNVTTPIRALIVSDHLIGLGDGGNFYTSATGQSWSLVATIPGGYTFRGGAYANVAGTGTYVAVGDAGALAVSHDGVQWSSINVPVNVILRAVAWTGTRFVIVGDNGTIYTSPNGVTVDHAPTSAITGTLRSVAVSATGEVVVVGDSGIESSTDGLTWHARDSAGAAALSGVGWVNGKFVAVGASSAIKTSTH